MKTTIDIPDQELKELLQHTKSRTKRAAVVKAVMDFNRRRRLAQLVKMVGTFEDFMTQEDLRGMREDRRWRKKQ